MKIFEIIEPKVISRARSRPFDEKYLYKRYDKQQNKYYANKPNTGLYSQGRTNINDPFMFTKITNRPSDLANDAYFNFVREIEPYMGSNPYLPRVYVTKIERDSTGQTIPKYQIEKLFSLNDLGDNADDILIQIRDKIFKNSKSIGYDRIFSMIASSLYDQNFDRIKDSSLKKALELITKIKKTGKFYYDLHPGNFMFRLGPTGTQLVITDPLN